MPTTVERTPSPAGFPSWSDWLPPAPWECPNCGHVLITREPAPRCTACGFHDA